MSPRADDIGREAARPPVILTIAGSDSCGGAGVQADLRTFFAFGLRGASAITALTAQDPRGIRGIEATSPEFVVLQARAALDGGSVAAVKTGMLVDAATVAAVASLLSEVAARPIRPALVVDPVMLATSGATLLEDGAVALLVERLFPLADVATPNLPEAARLLGEAADGASGWSRDDQERAARRLLDLGPRAVLVKGGHRPGIAADVLVERSPPACTWFEAPRIDAVTTHGTGCTLSAGIAAGIARGWPLSEAVRRAKAHLSRALAGGLDVPRPWRE